jgi:hypothetical protein
LFPPEPAVLVVMIERNEGPTGMIVFDSRYSPLIVVTFIGDLDLAQGRWFEETSLKVAQRESAKGRRLAMIHDATRSTRTSPEMRKFWTEMSKRAQPATNAATLASYIVVSNPVIRGVLTAISWVAPDVAKMETFANLDSAIGKATRVLEAAGISVTVPASGYELPAQTSRAVG